MVRKYNYMREFKSQELALTFISGIDYVNDSAVEVVGLKSCLPPHTPRNRKFSTPRTFRVYIMDTDNTDDKIRRITILPGEAIGTTPA
jgi:hypothetical protein